MILRDTFSLGLAEKELDGKAMQKVYLVGDLTQPLLQESKRHFEDKNIKNTRGRYVLVNLSPLCDFKKALKKVKNFLRKHPDAQPLYFPAHLGEDLQFF